MRNATMTDDKETTVYADHTTCSDCQTAGVVVYHRDSDYYHCTNCHNEWEGDK